MDDMLLLLVAYFVIVGVYLAALWALARDLRRESSGSVCGGSG